jgi:protein SCO1
VSGNSRPAETTGRASFLLTIACSLLALLLAHAAQAHDDRPIALRNVDLQQNLGAKIPLELEFYDATGKEVSLREYFSRRPVILSFVYYSCQDLCPLILDGLVRSLRPLSLDVGDQFDVVVVSFDPRDTPALATAKKADSVKQYARPDTQDGWHFLTGDENAIQRLTDAAGFRYNYESDKDRFGHATGIILLTPDGKIARYFYGMEFSPRDLRLGLIEASANKIGSPIDQLLLFCYHYDPVSGKYNLLITNVLRLAAIVTVGALAIFIALMLRRDRQCQVQPGESA